MGGGYPFHLELEEAGQEGLCALERTESFEKNRDMEMDAPFSVVGTGLAALVGSLKGGGGGLHSESIRFRHVQPLDGGRLILQTVAAP